MQGKHQPGQVRLAQPSGMWTTYQRCLVRSNFTLGPVELPQDELGHGEVDLHTLQIFQLSKNDSRFAVTSPLVYQT